MESMGRDCECSAPDRVPGLGGPGSGGSFAIGKFKNESKNGAMKNLRAAWSEVPDNKARVVRAHSLVTCLTS